MEIEKFVANVAEQFDETETSSFSEKTHFRDFEEWSSLLALSIIAMADEEYSVELKGEDIKKCETIEDLFNVIRKKKNAK